MVRITTVNRKKKAKEWYDMKTAFHVMLIPTLGCPSKCHYCWSSDEQSPRMSIGTVKEVVEWLKEFRDEQVTFTFHGGEPLLAGADFYREALPMLADGLQHLNPTFALQTNLWLMTPELAQVLAQYSIPIGSSIDGPEEICDHQRGNGYFKKTMRGYEIARANGLHVRFICTFTRQSVQSKEEIFDFFLRNKFTLKLHPALPSLRSDAPDEWALPPEEYGELLVFLLDKYLEHMDTIEVMNINDLCRCVFTRRGSVCTFVNCLGNTLAVGPDGSIYPCYRFVGMPEWVMANVSARPSMDDLTASAAWKRMQQFQDYVDEHCRECAHTDYCRGGCAYNAMAPSNGRVMAVDPHCPAYKRIFDEITERLNREMYESPPVETRRRRAGQRKPPRPGVTTLMREIVGKTGALQPRY